MLPEKLQSILKGHDPEDIEISILQVDMEKTDPIFRIQVSGFDYNDQDDYVLEWTVKTIHYRSSKISFDAASSIEISNDDPLLWYYSDQQCSIYFNGYCSDTDKLFLDLYRVHRSLFKGLMNFEETLNQPYNFGNLIQSKNGLFGFGPRTLLEKYATVLERHKIQYSIVGDRVAQYWNGEKYIDETGNAKVLFIDNSYIIADEFIFIS